MGWEGLFCFKVFKKRYFYPDLEDYLILAIFLVLRNSPEMGNHGELCSRPKYKAHNIKRHHHPRVLPFAEIESQNICFAKNKRKNRNRMLLLGLQATINKSNLPISQKRASHAGLLTQDCSSRARDAILINHSTDEKPLLLLSTFSPLTSSNFPLHYVTDNSETQKRFDPRKPCSHIPI